MEYKKMHKYISIFTVLFLYIIFLDCKFVYGGECLGSDVDMYKGILEYYESGKEGNQTNRYGRISLHCWRGKNDELNKKLKKLLQDMMLDTRLHLVYVAEAAEAYANKYGPSDFLMTFFKTAQGPPRYAILKALKYKKDTVTFNSESFLKEQIAIEPNPEVKHELLEVLSLKKNKNFNEFITFCEQHDIIPEEKSIYNFRDIAALKYLFAIKKLKTKEINYSNNDEVKQYHKYSGFIHDVLKSNLDMVFPEKYLDRMSSQHLRYLRNGIVATYGRNFRSKILQYYFYGSYSYVQSYCRNGQCGLGNRKKGQYKESDLTETDKINIERISNVENNRNALGYKEPGLFIENYDYNAFINNTKEHLTFSSIKIDNLKQIKLDWENREIWIWDKHGVSGWKLDSGKRIRLIKNAKGPINFSGKQRILCYQLNNKFILENVDNRNILFHEKLSKRSMEKSEVRYSVFSNDQSLFAYFSYKEKGQNYYALNMSVVNLNSGEKTEIPFARGTYVVKIDMGEVLFPTPLCITKDSKYLIALISKQNSTYFAVIDLEKPEAVRLVDTGFRDRTLLSIAADADEKYFYTSPYYEGDKISRYKIDEMLEGAHAVIKPDMQINLSKPNSEYNVSFQLSENILFKASTRELFWLDMKKLDQEHYYPCFPEFKTTTFDISKKHNLYAGGNRKGFVVIRRFPDSSKTLKAEGIKAKKKTVQPEKFKEDTSPQIDEKKYKMKKFIFTDDINFIDGPANLREQPNRKIIQTLPDNAKIKIVQQKEDWFEVKYGDHRGWIHKNNILSKLIGTIDNNGKTALSRAAYMGRGETVQFLLQKGADVNFVDKEGKSSLHWAIIGGFDQMRDAATAILKLLLDSDGPEVNKADNHGITPLMLAVKSKNIEMAKLLLSKNAIDINMSDDDGKTALIWAIRSSYKEMAKLLLGINDIDINKADNNNDTPLYHATLTMNIDILNLLLALNPKGDTINKDEKTVLHAVLGQWHASTPQAVVLLRTLLKIKGIDFNKEDLKGKTPLLLAIEGCNLEAVKLLISTEGVDVNKTYNNGLTYLQRVLGSSNLPRDYTRNVSKLLLAREDINVNIPDEKGYTPVHFTWYFVDSELSQIAELIMQRNPDVNVVSYYGETPLYYNVEQRNTEIVKMLLKVDGIDVHIPNKNGWTPLYIAKSGKNKEMIKLLENAGAKK